MGFRVQGFGFRVSGLGLSGVWALRVSEGFGPWGLGFGFRASGFDAGSLVLAGEEGDKSLVR